MEIQTISAQLCFIYEKNRSKYITTKYFTVRYATLYPATAIPELLSIVRRFVRFLHVTRIIGELPTNLGFGTSDLHTEQLRFCKLWNKKTVQLSHHRDLEIALFWFHKEPTKIRHLCFGRRKLIRAHVRIVPVSDRFRSLSPRVFSLAAAILKTEKTLGSRLPPS